MMEKIKVLVVDDHPLFREGLCRILNTEKDMSCMAAADSGEEGVKLTKKLLPDIALIDINMPGMDGIEVAKQIKAACPDTAVLMLSAYKYPYYVLSCLQLGVDGYMLKNAPRSELVNAIRMIHAGEGVFSIEATSKVMSSLGTDKEKAGTNALRKRELEVLKLAASGMANKDIASQLGISSNTVGTHFVNIFRKLGAQSRTEAILRALKEGWFILDEIQ